MDNQSMKIDFSTEGAKARYLKAGLTLFARNGYNLVSVRDIAAEAGISEAALYRHFKSKEEMALYLFRFILQAYGDGVKAIADQEGSAIDRLIQFQQYTYQFYHDDPESIRFGLLSQYQFWGQVDDELKPHFWLKALLEEGMENGEIAEKPVYLWISLYTGLLLEPLIQHSFFEESLPEWSLFSVEVGEAIQKLLHQAP